MSNNARANRRRRDRFIDPENPFLKLQNGDHFKWANLFTVFEEISDRDLEIFLERREVKGITIYEETWKKASRLYQKQLKKKRSVFSRMPKMYNIAIIAYTMDTGLYSDFNRNCRRWLTEFFHDHSFQYSHLFALLTRAIHTMPRIPNVKVDTLYRAMSCRVDNLNVGDLVHPSQIMSCTALKREAKKFVGVEGTLVTFKGSPMRAMGITRYSMFPQEKEVLVSPWHCFKVVKLERKGQVDNLVLELHAILDNLFCL